MLLIINSKTLDKLTSLSCSIISKMELIKKKRKKPWRVIAKYTRLSNINFLTKILTMW